MIPAKTTETRNASKEPRAAMEFKYDYGKAGCGTAHAKRRVTDGSYNDASNDTGNDACKKWRSTS